VRAALTLDLADEGLPVDCDGRRVGAGGIEEEVDLGRAAELSAGDEVIDTTLRGNRVRRFKDFDPVELPRPTVRLA